MTTPPTISSDTVYAACDDLLAAPLGDDVVILHLGSGTYFGLNEVAAFVWSHLPARSADLVEAVTGAFDVDAERVSADLEALLRHLESERLIRAVDASA